MDEKIDAFGIESDSPRFCFTRTHGIHLDDVTFLETKGYFVTGVGVDDSIWFRRVWIPEIIAKQHKGFPYLDVIDTIGERVSLVFLFEKHFFSYSYNCWIDKINKCVRLIPDD